MSDEEGQEWLIQILKDVQLEQFYVRIRDELQVCCINCFCICSVAVDLLIYNLKVSRLAHFDYVTFDDLENIGMGKPGARRLLDAVKKKKIKLRNKNLVNKILPPSISQQKSSKSQNSGGSGKKTKSVIGGPGVSALTCLIQEKVRLKYYNNVFNVCMKSGN